MVESDYKLTGFVSALRAKTATKAQATKETEVDDEDNGDAEVPDKTDDVADVGHSSSLVTRFNVDATFLSLTGGP